MVNEVRRGGINWKVGIYIYIYILCIKERANENLLYSVGNSTQYSAMVHMGKESKKSLCMYMDN